MTDADRKFYEAEGRRIVEKFTKLAEQRLRMQVMYLRQKRRAS